MTQFETVIGLEIHAELSTKTKLFCSCDNDSFNKEPNINVCPICMGFPGMLPVTNADALQKAITTSLAISCNISQKSKFDRKNYFYPDLPSGYQISQYDEPIGLEGFIEITIGDKIKKIKIIRLHLENDAGKLSHTSGSTLLDFNRAGTPLVEIVSYPDISNAEEAKIYAENIQKILRYCGSSDADMEKGMMRFDASVSIRPVGESKLYPRAEIKNLNSFRSLETAINYESQRQIDLWENGEPLKGDMTVGWDEESNTTKILRDKESAADYRYFPEPDLPPLSISEQLIDECRKTLPELPMARQKKFIEKYGLNMSEAIFYTEDKTIADYFEDLAVKSGNPSLANSFLGSILIKKLYDAKIEIQKSPISSENLAELIKLIDSGMISNNIAKTEVLDEMFISGKNPNNIVKEKSLSQISDISELEDLCKKIISENNKIVDDIKGGQSKAIGALVGAVIKASKGKANPKIVNDILNKLLLE